MDGWMHTIMVHRLWVYMQCELIEERWNGVLEVEMNLRMQEGGRQP